MARREAESDGEVTRLAGALKRQLRLHAAREAWISASGTEAATPSAPAPVRHGTGVGGGFPDVTESARTLPRALDVDNGLRAVRAVDNVPHLVDPQGNAYLISQDGTFWRSKASGGGAVAFDERAYHGLVREADELGLLGAGHTPVLVLPDGAWAAPSAPLAAEEGGSAMDVEPEDPSTLALSRGVRNLFLGDLGTAAGARVAVRRYHAGASERLSRGARRKLAKAKKRTATGGSTSKPSG